MPRIRNVKPGFFLNPELAELPPLTRILFEGLWCYADREGRLEDKPRKLKAEILPYDEHPIDVALNDLQTSGFILRYRNSTFSYIQILNFLKHQKPHAREPTSTIPAPVETGPRSCLDPVETGPRPSPAALDLGLGSWVLGLGSLVLDQEAPTIKENGDLRWSGRSAAPRARAHARADLKRDGERKRGSTASHGSRLTLLELPEDWRAWAMAQGDGQPDETWATFHDYWVGTAGQRGRKADWLATWRNWVRKDLKRSIRAEQPTRSGLSVKGQAVSDEAKRRFHEENRTIDSEVMK